MSSIFLDDKALQAAHGNLNNIIISDGSKTINGQLQETLQFSVEADYDNIFSINERFASTKALLGSAGLGLFNAGMWTKKFYKGGSYLKLNPKIRVTDWNADGEVLRSATALIDMCLPVFNGKLDLASKKMINNITAKVKKDGVGSAILDGVVAGVKAGISEIGDILSGEEANRLLNLLSGKEILSNSPSEVTITVSNFFGPKRFIIESVQVEFSKEMTEAGPLYVDINFSISTPMVTTKGNTGLHSVVNKPRFINLG
jgi:hypothetical protein